MNVTPESNSLKTSNLNPQSLQLVKQDDSKEIINGIVPKETAPPSKKSYIYLMTYPLSIAPTSQHACILVTNKKFDSLQPRSRENVVRVYQGAIPRSGCRNIEISDCYGGKAKNLWAQGNRSSKFWLSSNEMRLNEISGLSSDSLTAAYKSIKHFVPHKQYAILSSDHLASMVDSIPKLKQALAKINNHSLEIKTGIKALIAVAVLDTIYAFLSHQDRYLPAFAVIVPLALVLLIQFASTGENCFSIARTLLEVATSKQNNDVNISPTHSYENFLGFIRNANLNRS